MAVAKGGRSASLVSRNGIVGFIPGSLGIFDGVMLNAFMASPYDPDWRFEDIGYAVGFRSLLAEPGDRAFWEYNHYFSVPIPEPGTFGLLAAGILSLVARKYMTR